MPQSFGRIMFGACICAFMAKFGHAADLKVDRRLPNEYESVGGHGLGQSNMAAASQSGLASIRVNPGLLALEKSYYMGAGYNWPVAGRDFYQVGVVDGKSSSVAAGLMYTGFTEDYLSNQDTEERDSPVKRRFSLGLAQTLGSLSIGMGGQYVEGLDIDNVLENKTIKGTTLNIGAAGMLTPTLRFAVSVENLSNKKVAVFAPQTIRAGLALLIGNGDIVLNADYRQRERVKQMEQGFGTWPLGVLSIADQEEIDRDDARYRKPEQMGFVSGSARVYDILRVLGAYGQTLSGPERKSLSGGVAMVSNTFSLSYTMSRPYMTDSATQQAISASFGVNL